MKSKVFFILRLIAAVILLQTLFFKFTGAPESIYIFTTLKIEPWGRWLSGISELIASILLLITATQVIGAVMALGIMGGAILSHILFLGIVVQNDSGTLFTLAVIVFAISAAVVIDQRKTLFMSINKVRGI